MEFPLFRNRFRLPGSVYPKGFSVPLLYHFFLRSVNRSARGTRRRNAAEQASVFFPRRRYAILRGGINTMNYVYLLRCADGTLYCGWTTDPESRVRAHNSGRGAKYTRSRLPVELVYTEAYENRHQALSREWQLKRLSRKEKLALINCSPAGSPDTVHKRPAASGSQKPSPRPSGTEAEGG